MKKLKMGFHIFHRWILPIISEISKAIDEENYIEVSQLMISDEFYSIAGVIDSNSFKIYDTPSGKIGIYCIYKEDIILSQYLGNYYIYKGEFENNKREGNGIWINTDNMWSENLGPYCRIAKGTFKNDLPNGKFSTYIKDPNGEIHNDVVCDVKDGFFDGRCYEDYFLNSTSSVEESWFFENGYIKNYYCEELEFFDDAEKVQRKEFEVIDLDNTRAMGLWSEEQRELYVNTQYGIMGFGCSEF